MRVNCSGEVQGLCLIPLKECDDSLKSILLGSRMMDFARSWSVKYFNHNVHQKDPFIIGVFYCSSAPGLMTAP